ncbi:MAG: LPP20 family lipoprotein [Desulforegulaceae bacterium]|nr:LPP20 family lipoprotein [Desulforegulaceae bacterium]
MLRFKILTIFILGLFITGCMSSSATGGKNSKFAKEENSTPSWVYSPPEVGGYVYGVGMASIYSTPAEAMQRARENSRVELVKQLRVKVSGTTEASVKREIDQGKSKITRSVFNYAKSSIEETELPGIKIIKTAVSKKDNQTFALAELNRLEAEMDLSDKLESTEKKIDLIASQPLSGDKIKDIKKLMPAIELIEKRNKIVSDLRLVGTMVDEELEKESHIKLKSEIAELLDSLVIVLKPGSSGKNLSSGIRKALGDQSVRVRMSGEGDLYLKFSADLNTVFRDGIYFTFATGQASLMDKNNDIISEFSTKVKDGSGDKNLSVKRTVEKLADSLGNSVAKGIFDSI